MPRLLIIPLLLAALGASETPTKLRIIVVGNSFSGTAIQYLPVLVRAAGCQLELQNLEVGGSSLQVHWTKAAAALAHPDDPQGQYGNDGSLPSNLDRGPWDVVTIQQYSGSAGDAATYRPYADNLVALIRARAPSARILFQETWAYRRDDPRFKPGGPEASSEEMYQRIAAAYAGVARDLGLGIIPSGDAFHLLDSDPAWGFTVDPAWNPATAVRPSLPDQAHSLHVGWYWADGQPKVLYDGHHPDDNGKYLAACVWLETLYGRSAVGSTTWPTGMSRATATLLQETAHRAVQGRGAPVITSQPAARTATVGSIATFSVVATGTATLTYQWRKGGVAIGGATRASYTTPATVPGDDGAVYSVVVRNGVGSATSANAVLTVKSASAAPVITAQPADRTVAVGATASFTVVATGSPTPTCQWRRNGVAIAGATATTYTTLAATASDDGAAFSVVVANGAGSVTSREAALTVTTRSAPVITAQPADAAVVVGGRATFRVGAAGSPAPGFQWRRNGLAIAGATGATYTTPAVTASDHGAFYSAVASNSAGTATSLDGILTVSGASPSGGSGPGGGSHGGTGSCGAGGGIALLFAPLLLVADRRRRTAGQRWADPTSETP